MDGSKYVRWIIPFKKFGRLQRVKNRQVRQRNYYKEVLLDNQDYHEQNKTDTRL